MRHITLEFHVVLCPMFFLPSQTILDFERYSNADLILALYVRVRIKVLPWKRRILSHYRVIHP